MAFSFTRRAGFSGAIALLILVYLQPLADLIRLARTSQLYSHILLVPVVSMGLVWIQRKALPSAGAPDRTGALCFSLMSGGLLAMAGGRDGSAAPAAGYLAFTTLSFLGFVGALCCLFWGRARVRRLAFPLGFLSFMAPLPPAFESGLETFLQNHSATAAAALFRVIGTPVLHEDLILRLPGMTLEVTPQCSGIHSTLVLFIASLLLGFFWLRTPWKRWVLALLVVPFGILRNGLRIVTIGELCLRVDPSMIDSAIHRQGGPLFFLAAFAPFLGCALLLSRSDRNTASLGQSPD